MNNTSINLNNEPADFQSKSVVAAPPTAGLDLFAEELPVQQDLAKPATQSSYSTVASATGGGSTASTFSTIACL